MLRRVFQFLDRRSMLIEGIVRENLFQAANFSQRLEPPARLPAEPACFGVIGKSAIKFRRFSGFAQPSRQELYPELLK